EPDLLRDRKEALECGVADVDDLGRAVVRDQPVEQGHLPAGVADVGGDRRHLVAQRLAARIEIEGKRGGAVEAQKIEQQPRQEGLADLRTRGSDDENEPSRAGGDPSGSAIARLRINSGRGSLAVAPLHGALASSGYAILAPDRAALCGARRFAWPSAWQHSGSRKTVPDLPA